MIGHGGPTAHGRVPGDLARRAGCWLAWVGQALALAMPLQAASPGEHTLRVRIAWGGGTERVWRGVIGVDQGTVAEPLALGIEADEPGSMWLDPVAIDLLAAVGDRQKTALVRLEGEHLRIQQRSPRAYDGVDLLVRGPLEAALVVQLAPEGSQGPAPAISIPLSELVGHTHSADLDDRGNRLLVRRAPGDELRVRVAAESLVFAPGSLLRCQIEPHLLPVEPGTKVRIKVQLLPARSTGALWTAEHTITAGEPVTLPVEIRLDRGEGVYDVLIAASPLPGLRWPQGVASPLGLRPPVAERRVQVVVVDPDPAGALTGGSSEWSRVVEIDPANPTWWERFAKLPQLPRLPKLWKGPLGNGRIGPLQHPLGQLVQLRPAPNAQDASWEAYTLPINRPGLPHLLEVDYPSDVPQTMGISIIEPNASGAVMPIGLDSGVDVTDEIAGEKSAPRWEHHRLVFWPRTKTPMVLITNRRANSAAVYGKIRVWSGGQRLPRAFPGRGPRPERLLAAYLDRPLFPETFGATDPPGSLSDLSVDDWVTFYEGGTRLVEYLHYAGHTGLMLAALADGSAIYPSRLVEPTPRYDTGLFLPAGQDPVRKDVLELLFQLFDREGLQLVPAIEFAAPLPELEDLLRRGGPEAEGVRWIGPDGAPWTERFQPVRGLAPYYNTLHPRVQEAMLRVVGELAERYAEHLSFTGLGLHLSAYGYAQLPGPDWGLDDLTIARFQQDTRIQVPGAVGDPARFAQRAAFLSGEARKEWLAWRADQLSRFHRRVAAELVRHRPGARLYLAGAESLSGEESQRELQPTLGRRLTIGEALLSVGIDARRYAEDGEIVLLRPERIAPQWSLAGGAVDLEIGQMSDADRYWSELSVPGSLLFHVPQELRLPSFDEKSPFRPTYTWLLAQPAPSGAQNRRRFVRSLAAIDAQAMFDGGWQLPLGQEGAMRELIAAFRQLPAERFRRVPEPPGGPSAQPVTVRVATRGNFTYAYVVNDAPFSTTLRVGVDAPASCSVEELSGLRRIAPLAREGQKTVWTAELRPYDLLAVRFSLPDIKLYGPQASWPSEVRLALEMRINELGERAAALRNPPLFHALENPGFDGAPSPSGQIPGWTAIAPATTTVRLDPKQPQTGAQAVYMASRGPGASLVSRPFEAPGTGRLWMWVWLRTADEKRQPPLRLALEGKHKGRDFFRFAQVGQAPTPGAPVPPVGAAWSQFVFPVNDLPLDSLSALQIRFDLLGPGEVWIDNVQLCDLAFNKQELVEMFRLISPADVKLRNGQVADCIRLLEGYWARFLVDRVPPAAVPITRHPAPKPPAAPPEPAREPPRTGLLERLRNLVPDRLRL